MHTCIVNVVQSFVQKNPTSTGNYLVEENGYADVNSFECSSKCAIWTLNLQ